MMPNKHLLCLRKENASSAFNDDAHFALESWTGSYFTSHSLIISLLNNTKAFLESFISHFCRCLGFILTPLIIQDYFFPHPPSNQHLPDLLPWEESPAQVNKLKQEWYIFKPQPSQSEGRAHCVAFTKSIFNAAAWGLNEKQFSAVLQMITVTGENSQSSTVTHIIFLVFTSSHLRGQAEDAGRI